MIALAKWIGLVLAAAGGAAVWYVQIRHPVALKSRQAVNVFGAIWIAILLLEFYALGPASYISMHIDGNLGPTYYTYLAERHLGGQVAHAYGGGHDVDAIIGFGTQFFSLERILFSLLPIWLAILALKVSVTAVGFSGAYKLCRVSGQFDRTLAAGLAALFTVIIFYHYTATIWHGLGYSILPWVIYLGVVRERRRYYLSGLVVLGIIASTVEPTHIFVAMVSALVAGAVMLGKVTLRTATLPLGVVFVSTFANWHEVLYALKQIAPLTIRGNYNSGDLTLFNAIGEAFFLFAISKTVAAGVAVSVLVLAYQRNPFFWNAIKAIAALMACYIALVRLPWEIIGLGAVKGLSPHYLYYTNSVVLLFVAGKAVVAFETQSGEHSGSMLFGKRWPRGLLFAAIAAMLVLYKTETIAKYVYYGGQSQYSTIENLATPDWAKPEPFRVVTLRHQRPEPELAAAFYGLDTYDGVLIMPPAAYVIYWRDGILKGKGFEGILSRLALERRHFSGPAYDINSQANLSLLGVANVAFIISPVPLKGDVRLVSGPEKPPARLGDGLMTFAADRLSRIIRYGKVYVYALPSSLPRAFAARTIHRVGAEVNDAILLKTISRLAPARTAVVRGTPETFSYGGNLETMRVTNLAKTINGYDVVVDAPDGGVLVLNVPPVPFWTAVAAGTPLKITPVNMIHMAATVPAGTKLVSFRYQRPTLYSVLKEAFR